MVQLKILEKNWKMEKNYLQFFFFMYPSVRGFWVTRKLFIKLSEDGRELLKILLFIILKRSKRRETANLMFIHGIWDGFFLFSFFLFPPFVDGAI